MGDCLHTPIPNHRPRGGLFHTKPSRMWCVPTNRTNKHQQGAWHHPSAMQSTKAEEFGFHPQENPGTSIAMT
jgi:hypothetical protein